jgi:hypothetical protein
MRALNLDVGVNDKLLENTSTKEYWIKYPYLHLEPIAVVVTHGDTCIPIRFYRETLFELVSWVQAGVYIELLKRVQVTTMIIATILSMLFANCSSFLNLNHSHTHFWNAIVPPEVTPWKEWWVWQWVIACIIWADAVYRPILPLQENTIYARIGLDAHSCQPRRWPPLMSMARYKFSARAASQGSTRPGNPQDFQHVPYSLVAESRDSH